MRKTSIILFSLILLGLLVGCTKKDTEAPNDNSKSNPKLVEAIFDVTGVDEGNNDRYVYFYEDLNDDNKDEVIVYLWGDDFSGTAGGTMIIFQSLDEGYEFISKTTAMNMPIIISTDVTNSFNDLIVTVSGGGINEAYNVVLKFENGTYPLNATLQPKIDISTVKAKVTLNKDITPDAGFPLTTKMDN